MLEYDAGLHNKDEFLQINLSYIHSRIYASKLLRNNIKKGYESFAEIVYVNKADKTLLNLQ